jgi:hypothetical protein
MTPEEASPVKQQQIVKRPSRPQPQPIDLRTPTGRALPF